MSANNVSANNVSVNSAVPEQSVKRILILAANPGGISRSRLDEEVREVEEGLRRAQQRDGFELFPKWAVRPRDVQRAVLDVEPQIVHFAGCGNGTEGLVFENDAGQSIAVSEGAIAGLFALFSGQIECVVLNGCYLPAQAAAIAQHIPYVVGLSQTMDSRAAIEFAIGFYDALGAGRSIEFAYEFGCSAMRMSGLAESLVPVLITGEKAGVNSQSGVDADSEKVMTTAVKVDSAKVELSAGGRRRLTVECEELQAQFDALSEEIRFLQEAERTDDLSPKATLRLKKQIEQARADRQLVSEQLADMEDKLRPQV